MLPRRSRARLTEQLRRRGLGRASRRRGSDCGRINPTRRPRRIVQDGEGVYLHDAAGRLVDSVTYGLQLADFSIGRTNGGGAWLLGNPTLGTGNHFAALGNATSVRINEWLAAPGRLDPHGSLADGLLTAIDRLPAEQRGAALRRLRVITPRKDALMPLNVLTLPDFSWVGNALVQAGERVWGDFWGPRMQAALLALARLGSAWNRAHPDRVMGLTHTVFAAYDPEWRAEAMRLLAEGERLGAAALDALLGQHGERPGARNHQWVTEVVSPILSKLMSLELSPWLFAALHQDRFVNLDRWVREQAWVVLRLPAGEIGREGARMTAGFVYNLFEAAYRKVTSGRPLPFTFVIDETQEIAQAMRLETLLSEGGKFGARMFVLAQSLSMLRQVEGFEPVVQSLLANTSAQLFFSPDPEDADLIRATLSTFERYGATSIDVPSLQAWLRARIDGRWQPPALIEVAPLGETDLAAVERVIQEVVAAHPEDYVGAGAASRPDAMAAFDRTYGQNDPDRRDVPEAGRDSQQLGW